jgi:hypothetical protein
MNDTTAPISDLISLTQLCKALGVSRPTCMNYIALNMPVVTTANRAAGIPWEFSLSECQEWLSERDQEKQANHSQKMQEQIEDAGIVAARIAKLNVETERLQLRLARERGELVPIEKVAEIVEGQMTTLRTHLLALPIKLAPILVGHDAEFMKEKISGYIREALEELAEDKVVDGVTPDQVDELVYDEDAGMTDPLEHLLGITSD